MNIQEYENYHEIKSHYEPNFSYNTYLCSMPSDFLSVPLHWHSEMEIIYIKKGVGVVSVDLMDYTVTENDLVLILPGQLHSISHMDNSLFEYENIIFNAEMLLPKLGDRYTEEFFGMLLRHEFNLPVIINDANDADGTLRSCLERADTICSTFPNGYYLGIRACLYDFFFHMYIMHIKNADTITVRLPVRTIDKIKTITKYIEENYIEEITVKKMAKICDFSQSHFMKFFKNNMNMTFTQYLNDYRLTIASKILLSSSSTILETASECGFNNLSYFNRMFKEKYGMTPRVFRKCQNQQ